MKQKPELVTTALADTIASLESQMVVMVEYIKVKLAAKDYHGVRDAAVDIELLARELEIWRAMR